MTTWTAREEEVTFKVWHVPGQRARAPCRGFPFWSQCCLTGSLQSAVGQDYVCPGD